MKPAPNQPEAEEVPQWVLSLAEFLSLQPHVGAVRVDLAKRQVSLATLSPVDSETLQAQLSAVLEAIEKSTWPALPTSGKVGMVNLQGTGSDGRELLFSKPSCPTAPQLWRWRRYDWPEEIESETADEWQNMARQAALCGGSLLAGWLWHRGNVSPAWIGHAAYAVALISGGWDAAQDAWQNLRKGVLDVHFLMLAVAAGAVAIGAWTEGALLLFLFSSSGAMEHYAEHRTHAEISALTKATPKTATVILASGHRQERAVALLEPKDMVEVKPDEIFPADGIVVKGETSVDESNLTGESLPVRKSPGSQISSGTLNQSGAVQVRLTKPARQSTVQTIIRLIAEARQQRSPSQRLTDRFGTTYTLGILGLTVVSFLVWWLWFDLPPWHSVGENRSAFYRAMALLVVASPCAMVLSIPSATLAAMARAAKLGILFRSGAAIEKLAEIDTVALDKTGTLTTGEMQLTTVESFPPGNEALMLQIACSAERLSKHPIARAIVSAGEARGVPLLAVDEFVSLTGQGLRASIGGETVVLGRRELISQGEFTTWLAALPPEPLAASEVWVLTASGLGRLLLVDQIRPASAQVIAELTRLKIRTLMLTGDRRQTATEVAQELGVTEVKAGLSPEEKLATIRELTTSGRKVAMVGDGVNDAPSLAAAHVAIAMGSRGSDAAMEQADVILLDDKIEKFLLARQLSHQARRIMRQNLVLSLGTIIIMVATTLTAAIPLTLGVVAHEGSTVLVCLNSLRLLFFRGRK